MALKWVTSVISSKEEISYLGCILDKHMSGDSMATKVIKKVNQRTRFLGRMSSIVNKSALRTLAGALIQPLFDYASTSWYSGIKMSLKNKLQTSQTRPGAYDPPFSHTFCQPRMAQGRGQG